MSPETLRQYFPPDRPGTDPLLSVVAHRLGSRPSTTNVSPKSMSPYSYITRRQTLWALRHGKRLGGQFRHDPDPVQAERGEKVFTFDLEAKDRATAEASVKAMCEKLLANPVIESYRFTVEE